jgi:hypothetical protein
MIPVFVAAAKNIRDAAYSRLGMPLMNWELSNYFYIFLNNWAASPHCVGLATRARVKLRVFPPHRHCDENGLRSNLRQDKILP